MSSMPSTSERIALSKAKQKDYRERNRKRIAADKKAWRLANPDKVKASKIKHEAKKDAARKTVKRFKESTSNYTTD